MIPFRRRSLNEKESRNVPRSNVSKCWQLTVLTGIVCRLREIGHLRVRLGGCGGSNTWMEMLGDRAWACFLW